MRETLWPLAAGFMLGVVFFGGLWWTVRHVGTFRRPALTVLGGSLLRMSIVLGGFYVVAAGEWSRVLLCLLGLLIARLSVTWATRLQAPATLPEARHAP